MNRQTNTKRREKEAREGESRRNVVCNRDATRAAGMVAKHINRGGPLKESSAPIDTCTRMAHRQNGAYACHSGRALRRQQQYTLFAALFHAHFGKQLVFKLSIAQSLRVRRRWIASKLYRFRTMTATYPHNYSAMDLCRIFCFGQKSRWFRTIDCYTRTMETLYADNRLISLWQAS